MNASEFPKFIQNVPHGLDKFEGGSANRVSDAIKNHINNYDSKSHLPKIIGLDGPWGSGKSNVIKILKKSLIENYYVFEYDAWGHQEDLQRRSFIETLTSELVKEKILIGNTTVRMKNGDSKSVTWNDKLKYLLARKYESETKTYPKIGYGVLIAFFATISTPLSYFLASFFVKSFISLIIAAAPLIITLILWGLAIRKNDKNKKIEYLLAIYQDKITEDIKYETISEDEPSISDFKNWMGDVSEAIEKNKKLIIVFDNMDRLPTDKVKQLWSSIHTFFADNNGYKNIWVIIPFDKVHLANAFGEGEEAKNHEIICHFINKTFPVIYKVAPPVMTAWKQIFNDFYSDAFGTTEENDKVIIQRIFGILKPINTPRDIISFINELVSLKQMWKEEIPLLHIAIFALQKEIILNTPVESILSGNYLELIKKIIDNTDELQGNIASLTYGIELEIAKQIPLMQFLRETLKGASSNDINEYSEHKHFVEILDTIIKDIDIATLDSTILNLARLDTKINITSQWNTVTKFNTEVPIEKLAFESTYQTLIEKSDEKHKIILAKDLCKKYSEFKEFNGKEYFVAMQNLESCAKENEIDISSYIKNKKVLPGIFIDYMSQAKDKYNSYKLTCDSKLLNEYLIELIPNNLSNMDFISYLMKDESYSFDKLKERIETLITADEITINNLSEIIKTYKIISEKKPLKQQFSPSLIRSLINTVTDKTSDSYYDLVAMELTNQLIDTPYSDGLDSKVAERLEYYKSYGELLILSKDWGSDLLRKSVKVMVEKSYGKIMNIESILPFYQEIVDALAISPNVFLHDLNRWQKFKDVITSENIETIIPKSSFYEHSSTFLNDLTSYINTQAISKLESITIDEIYQQRNSPNYYWFKCIYSLIKNNILKTVPDNFTEFCKKILNDVSSQAYAIPTKDSDLDVLISKINKNKLQPTIKSICDDFCNKTKTITPALFKYFALNFDFINKMNSREGDISRNIISEVITDVDCLRIILDKSSDYSKTINKAGDDAEDLKARIKDLMSTNTSDELKDFALSIGISVDKS